MAQTATDIRPRDRRLLLLLRAPICPDCMTPSPVGMRCPECAGSDAGDDGRRLPRRRLRHAPATFVLIASTSLAFLAEVAGGGGGLRRIGFV